MSHVSTSALDADTAALLAQIAEHEHQSRAAILRMLIHQRARQLCILPPLVKTEAPAHERAEPSRDPVDVAARYRAQLAGDHLTR